MNGNIMSLLQELETNPHLRTIMENRIRNGEIGMERCKHVGDVVPERLRRATCERAESVFKSPIPGKPNSHLQLCIRRLFASARADLSIFEMIATHLKKNPDVISEYTQSYFLENCIDAFLDHDYAHSLTFYTNYAFVTAALKFPSWDHFLQLTLTPIFEGDPRGVGAVTPWGTPYILHPAGKSQEEIMKPLMAYINTMKKVMQGEGELLEALLEDENVKCNCLNVEDPYHPDFGKRVVGVMHKDHGKRKNKHACYTLNCACCDKQPLSGDIFKKCSRCKRVRYCSKDCQKNDWGKHKAKCGRKTADWWGCEKTMTPERRVNLGIS